MVYHDATRPTHCPPAFAERSSASVGRPDFRPHHFITYYLYFSIEQKLKPDSAFLSDWLAALNLFSPYNFNRIDSGGPDNLGTYCYQSDPYDNKD